MIWLLAILPMAAFFCWAGLRSTKSDGKYLPGDLRQHTGLPDTANPVYDWLAEGDFDHEFMAGPLNDRCHQIIDTAVCGAPREEHVS